MIGQHRSTQRLRPIPRDDEAALTAAIVTLASKYGRYGYRRVTALLRSQGWDVNVKRVWRIWRREGLKVPTKQPKRGRLWLNDGSCIRLRPVRRNHVWAYDFVQDRTHDGRTIRMLTVIDEFTRECLAIEVARSLRHDDVLHVLADLFARHGPPDHIRSDNGSEFTAIAVREWLPRVGVKTLFIEPGSPWENGYNESFNGKLRDETAQRRDLLHPGRSQDPDRALAPALQHRQAALITRLQAAGTTDDLAADGQIALPSNRPGSLIETGPLIRGRPPHWA